MDKAKTLRTTPVEPIGTITHRTFFENRFCGDRAVLEYPPSPGGDALRSERLYICLPELDAAKRLGLSAVEYSELERGRRTCDWDEAMRLLREGGTP